MKKLLIAACSSIVLFGCASKPVEIDPTPMPFDKNDSIAMSVLKQGWRIPVPLNIKDAEVPEDSNYNRVSYTASTGLGFLSNGLTGAVGAAGLAAMINVGSHPLARNLNWVFWIPADDIDINDSVAVNEYVKKNYIKPALEEYIASDENKKLSEPVKLVGYEDGHFILSGEVCWSAREEKPEQERYHQCKLLNNKVAGNRYATPNVAIPFNLTEGDDAKRYIVASAFDTSDTSHILLPYIQSKMTYVFVPGQSYKASMFTRFTTEQNRLFHNEIPYVVGEGKTLYTFTKVKNQ
ncbi:hypothetical protein AB4455_04860 [Vibrio sp. 10N.261.46.E12]|uniref:hypothetical protein n=1 Tax=unclassified Vibrio TaxID=2614977 RepID=UPI00097873E0|nr:MULTISPECIES: hypothetical protein [unclassified Vibrio]OMO36219.1 hypothetical protein BH584_05430 [Vibrio sp. 10N.261.45.E1]PMJ34429.1 hypothetical protein BCU27_03105 [Vibrio sp. 10N.286.45.B6]PML86800.1 hypothetical protein BCT66_00810 [Vibrio sp. 10N.261.49.E11]PMM76800.1 hypothetical protein BCT48_24685 [Vibrio sp. 10N.261.46.F12]PMM81832.1 hypothetical protein BCT46_15610 [Vibrio sp. 10N.261.46.E8]